MPVVILGAGLAGLSAAYQLEKKGQPYLLFERESRPGGLVRSEVVNGYTFDYTGHLLHLAKPETRELVLQELGLDGQFEVVERRSFIFSHGVYTRYPFQANTYGLPLEVVRECLEGFVEAKIKAAVAKAKGAAKKRKKGPEVFEDWIVASLGEGIAKHFMRPYNTKLWGVPPSEMTTEWRGRFIPEPSLREVILGALADQKNAVGYNANFLYPKQGGIEVLARAFAKKVKVKPSQEAVEIDLAKRSVRFKDGSVVEFKRLISTLPLKKMLGLVPKLPQAIAEARRQLRAVNVFNVNLGVEGRGISDKHWIYVPEEKYPFYRIGFCHNFSRGMVPPGCSSLYAELSYDPEKPIDKIKMEDKVRQGLVDMGVLSVQDRIGARFIADIPNAYVVYDLNRTPAVTKIQKFLRQHGVTSTGRWGAWEYGSMEDAIWQGARAALQG